MSTVLIISVALGLYVAALDNLVSILSHKRLSFSSRQFSEDTLQSFSVVCLLGLICCAMVIIAKLSLAAMIFISVLTYVLISHKHKPKKIEKT